MEEAQEEIRVFLDASVLVAAALSQRGGSFRVLSEAALRGYRLFTTRYAFQEAEKTIQQEKYSHLLQNLYHLRNYFIFSVEPPNQLTKEALQVIDLKDAPVLAGALVIKVQVILTLDRKHFLENPVLNKVYPSLLIMTPGDFIRKYFI